MAARLASGSRESLSWVDHPMVLRYDAAVPVVVDGTEEGEAERAADAVGGRGNGIDCRVSGSCSLQTWTR